MKKKIRKLLKNKTFILFMILFIIFLVCLFLLRGVFFPGAGSKYGHRLDGINKISFTKKDQNSVIESIEKSLESIKIQGFNNMSSVLQSYDHVVHLHSPDIEYILCQARYHSDTKAHRRIIRCILLLPVYGIKGVSVVTYTYHI